jgi:hypothetical protein
MGHLWTQDKHAIVIWGIAGWKIDVKEAFPLTKGVLSTLMTF